MEWTESQKEAIKYKGENILLSASAGSGKTAVLVQRVIEKILDKENPVSISELLILTFTDAAASEMKHKISEAINKEFMKDPQNKHLKNQRILIGSANISTIHSFCLEVIKGNIHKTDIPVNFSIISEIENMMMKENALDEVLGRFYENLERVPSFKQLALGYGSDKGDWNLREILRGIMSFAISMPDPAKWLNDAAKEYKFEKFAESVWNNRLFEYAKKLALRLEEIYDAIIAEIDKSLPADHKYCAFFLEEKESVNKTLEFIGLCDYEKFFSAINSFAFKTLPTAKPKELDEEIAQSNIKKLRELAKDVLKEIKSFFVAPIERVEAQIKETEPLVRTLKNIVLMTMRAHKRLKRQGNYLDFNDLEHELIGILMDKRGRRTDVAFRLQEKYAEILVDEYQDTNYTQDKIFSLISREDSNIFTVGDVKQSIYKFRNAVPEIFSEKYNRYGENQGGHRITLAKNFRSRDNILSFANFVFERIMTKETGGIEYDKGARLELGADYEKADNPKAYKTEFNMIDGREIEDHLRAEAICVGKRIVEMVKDKELIISDLKTGEKHPVRFSDIVILVRKVSGITSVFEDVFSQMDIPLYSESGKSYLTSTEVQTVLSFLQVIDNPRQDIPLIATLRSPMWQFTSDMLAEIRKDSRKVDFYESVKMAAEKGNISCARFVSELEDLRLKAEFLKVSDLVMLICNKYRYSEIVSGMDNGEQRKENLRLLFERALEFDTGDNGSLMGFMRYIETILEAKKDLTPAKIDNENSNAVKIMTIHKSKGLEFPVVILANAFSRFNMMDANKRILHHSKLGIGFKYVDTDKRIIYPSVPHKILSLAIKEELLEEEMRLLYVALTRAKEKLIISSVIKNRENSWKKAYLAQDKVLSAGVFGANSLGVFICHAVAEHKGSEILDDMYEVQYRKRFDDTDAPFEVNVIDGAKIDCRAALATVAKTEDGEMDDELLDKLKNCYAFSKGENIPLKMSVSEAKRRQSEEEFYSPSIFTIPTISASDVSLISPTDRGTISHFVLQHLDFKKVNSIEMVEAEVEKMASSGLISEAQRKVVKIKELWDFCESPLGSRLRKAVEIKKEFNFYTKVDAGEFYSELKGKGEEILLQGTMDCFFEEANGNIVLIDYKTDRVNESIAIERGRKYLPQLRYYKKGLEEIMGKKIKDVYVCFLSCNKQFSIDELE